MEKIKSDGADPLETFDAAIRNVSPLMEVRSRRVGGANYQVPREVPQQRRLALAFRWLISGARAKKGRPMAEKLAEELLLASKNEGEAIKKKDEMHRMAEANKAFAHFAW
jgi:small subunit ribosomal protein S7